MTWVTFIFKYGDYCSQLPGTRKLTKVRLALKKLVTEDVIHGAISRSILFEMFLPCAAGAFGAPGTLRIRSRLAERIIHADSRRLVLVLDL